MSAFVIDASVAIALISPDEQTDAVFALFDRMMDHGAFAPTLWLFETANAARYKWAKSAIASASLREGIEKIHGFPVELVELEPRNISGSVLTLALRHKLTIYDASYLNLAIMLSLPLATFDKELIIAAPAQGVELVSI